MNFICKLFDLKIFLKEDEFMGRCCVVPKIINSEEIKLEWHKLFLKHTQAGDILASFELKKQTDNLIAKTEMDQNKISLYKNFLNPIDSNRMLHQNQTFKTKAYVLEVFFLNC